MSKIYRMNESGVWQEIGLDDEYINQVNTSIDFDQTFKPGTGPSRNDSEIIGIQSDGKILMRVYGGDYDSNSLRSYRLRINADGTYDSDFSINMARSTIGSPSIEQAIIHNDRLMISGSTEGLFYNQLNIQPSTPYNGIFKYNSDGSIDSKFMRGMNFGFASPVYEFVVDSSDAIILHCASPNSFNGQAINSNLVYLAVDQEDPQSSYVMDLPSVRNYNLVKYAQYPFASPLQYIYSEQYDNFKIKGIDKNNNVYIWTLSDSDLGPYTLNLPDGRVYYQRVGATPTTFDRIVYEYDPDVNDWVYNTYKQKTYGNLIRIDGSSSYIDLDTAFTYSATPLGLDYDVKIKFKDNNKIIIFQDIEIEINSTPSYKLIELNENGAINYSFMSNSGNLINKLDGIVNSKNIVDFDIFNNKTVLISETYDNNTGYYINTRFVRLNDDGSPDEEFNSKINNLTDSQNEVLFHQPNGKIVVLANGIGLYGMPTLNGIESNSRLFRINPDNILIPDINVNQNTNNQIHPFLLLGD